MKIEDSNQNMAVMQQVNSRAAERPDATGAQAQSDSVKPKLATDKVELSGRMNMKNMRSMESMEMTPEMTDQMSMRAQRVADIKAQVQAGTYQVDSRAVAEKMIARVGSGSTVH